MAAATLAVRGNDAPPRAARRDGLEPRAPLAGACRSAASTTAAAGRPARSPRPFPSGRLDAIYSSDLARARETAEIVGEHLGLPVALDPRLREVDVGEWSGLTSTEVERRYPDGYRRRLDGEHGMGARRDIRGDEPAGPRRAALRSPSGRDGGRILVVTHGGPMRAAWLAAGGEPAPWQAHVQLRRGRDRRRGRPDAAARLIPRWRTTRTSTRVSRSRSHSSAGEYQDGVLTAYCYVEDVAHIELNGHILIPLQNIASLHCSSRCDAPEPDWPPHGLAEDDADERDDEA